MCTSQARETQSVTRRLTVLLCAYACDPTRGSENAVGWAWSTAIAQYHDVWVIAGEQCRGPVEAELGRRPELAEHMHFYFIRQRQLHWLERIWPPLEMLTYIHQWQRAAYRLACRLHQEVRFDLVHQVTYVGWRAPGLLWKLDVPFVWGPIGGIENTPWRLLPAMGTRGLVYYGLRNVINGFQIRFSYLPRQGFRRAAALIAATSGVARCIERSYARRANVICEVSLPPVVAAEPSVRDPAKPLKMAWSGEHQPGKALPLLLHALARLPAEVPWELDVLGQGPCTQAWRRVSRALGLDPQVTWHGWLPRQDALRVVRTAHLFVITSLKDLTSTVIIEALALGVPVICPDHCGFSDVVTDECGIKLPIDSVRHFEAELAQAIVRLASDEPERRRLAAGALERAKDFSWEKKAEAVDQIYRRVLAQRAGQPGQIEQPAAEM